ncbi:MAG: hypothetical protein LLF89_01285 [Spirochaetaceae bacterium]|nr:hypothetical protein [Spirochaetaceae bacterium]
MGTSYNVPLISWVGDKGQVWVANEQTDREKWTELTNADFRSHGVKKPYLAPPGATKAVISLKAATCVEGKLPRIFVDDVEFVEEKQGETGDGLSSALRINNHDKKQIVFSQRRKGRKGFQSWRLCVLARNLLVVVSR